MFCGHVDLLQVTDLFFGRYHSEVRNGSLKSVTVDPFLCLEVSQSLTTVEKLKYNHVIYAVDKVLSWLATTAQS